MRPGAAILASMLLCAAISGPVSAQDKPTEDRPARIPGGLERLTAAFLGFEAAGEPAVSQSAARGEAVLAAPLRLIEEGRLSGPIETSGFRMLAGTPVVHRLFKPRDADQSDAIEAWCGPGESRGMFGWAGATVCMVHTGDGKANLGVPALAFGPWWMANNVTFVSPEARTERVAVEPAATPTAFSLMLVYERLRGNSLAVHGAIEGPGFGDGARPYRHNMPRRILPLGPTGAAIYEYDGLRLAITPEGAADRVRVSFERVGPPIDVSAFKAEGQGAVATELVEGPIKPDEEAAPADGLAVTPFVIGGLRIDPASLVPGEGLLARGGVALRGRANYAVTGRLARDLTLKAPLVNDVAPMGTILHQLEFAPRSDLGTRTMTRIWCGPIGRPTVFSRERITMCLRRNLQRELEAFWPSTGRPWLGTTQASAALVALDAMDFEIETSPVSLLEAVDFRVEVQRITEAAVTVRMFARRRDEDALILTSIRPFDDGRATVSLWSHSLVLTRSGTGVIVDLSANGDGTAPSDQDGAFYP